MWLGKRKELDGSVQEQAAHGTGATRLDVPVNRLGIGRTDH
jgi:hypothetical protein